MLSAVGTNEGIELLLNRLSKTDNNAQFLATPDEEPRLRSRRTPRAASATHARTRRSAADQAGARCSAMRAACIRDLRRRYVSVTVPPMSKARARTGLGREQRPPARYRDPGRSADLPCAPSPRGPSVPQETVLLNASVGVQRVLARAAPRPTRPPLGAGRHPPATQHLDRARRSGAPIDGRPAASRRAPRRPPTADLVATALAAATRPAIAAPARTRRPIGRRQSRRGSRSVAPSRVLRARAGRARPAARRGDGRRTSGLAASAATGTGERRCGPGTASTVLELRAATPAARSMRRHAVNRRRPLHCPDLLVARVAVDTLTGIATQVPRLDDDLWWADTSQGRLHVGQG